MVIKQYRSITMKAIKQCVPVFRTITTCTWANCAVYKNLVTKCNTWLQYGIVEYLDTPQMYKFVFIYLRATCKMYNAISICLNKVILKNN